MFLQYHYIYNVHLENLYIYHQKISGVSESLKKENNLKIGGFVKYYELETYEDVLASARYVEHNNLNDILIWDEKLSYVITYKDDKILIDFAKLGDRYTNFQDEHYKYSDIAEIIFFFQ
mgnify:CR=1 FL=1